MKVVPTAHTLFRTPGARVRCFLSAGSLLGMDIAHGEFLNYYELHFYFRCEVENRITGKGCCQDEMKLCA